VRERIALLRARGPLDVEAYDRAAASWDLRSGGPLKNAYNIDCAALLGDPAPAWRAPLVLLRESAPPYRAVWIEESSEDPMCIYITERDAGPESDVVGIPLRPWEATRIGEGLIAWARSVMETTVVAPSIPSAQAAQPVRPDGLNHRAAMRHTTDDKPTPGECPDVGVEEVEELLELVGDAIADSSMLFTALSDATEDKPSSWAVRAAGNVFRWLSRLKEDQRMAPPFPRGGVCSKC
jgi:hypothetical protein